MQFLIFFSIVIMVYALVNFYIFKRGLQALPPGTNLRSWYIWLFWIIAASFVAGRFLERAYNGPLSQLLVWTGSIWLAAMLFFFLIVVVIDLARLINLAVPYLPTKGSVPDEILRLRLFWGSLVLVSGLVLGGFINARYPKVNTLEITIAKPAAGMDRLEAVVMSDIHLGTIIGRRHLKRIVNKVNNLKPDIILLPGDILDEDVQLVIKQNTGETLKKLTALLGVFGVMGNHEYIGGGPQAYEYLSSHGITMLRDTIHKVNDSFILVGREDRDKPRFTGRQRLPLDSLLEQVDFSYPVILMDHQPFYLEQAAALGVDLQLSGHTHNGQLWPLNYIINAMYTLGSGYGKFDNMHAYVSNGVGTWGPPVRLGNRPEILQLIIHFSEKQ